MYLEFVVIFVRFWEADHPLITKKPARNPPICGHTCGANCGADFGGSFKQNLLDKVSWHMSLFPVLPNKYYTFVTSPFLSASPSPAPVCSIFWGPNRLDLWLDLSLKLLFDCQNLLKVTNGVAVDIYLKFVVILFDFGRSVTLLSPKNMPGTHQYVVTPFPNIGCQHECEPMQMQCLAIAKPWFDR